MVQGQSMVQVHHLSHYPFCAFFAQSVQLDVRWFIPFNNAHSCAVFGKMTICSVLKCTIVYCVILYGIVAYDILMYHLVLHCYGTSSIG